jgi:hypothetical protein
MPKDLSLDWSDASEKSAIFQDEIRDLECCCSLPALDDLQWSPGFSAHHDANINNLQETLYNSSSFLAVRVKENPELVCLMERFHERDVNLNLTFKVNSHGDLGYIEELFLCVFTEIISKFRTSNVGLLWTCANGASLEYKALVNMGFLTVKVSNVLSDRSNNYLRCHHLCQSLVKLQKKVDFWGAF